MKLADFSMFYWFITILLTSRVCGLHVPKCSNVEFFDASSFTCKPCPVNASMITSSDSLSCTCEEHSVMTGSGHCRACNMTEVVSADGNSCVPRRCQVSDGRIVCRKCPNDSVVVTLNHDGTPLKEVQCVKCARGYRFENNKCIKCESCLCSRNEVVVRDKCLPKKYVVERPRYEENLLHPSELLDIVKYEYMCTIYNISACRRLARECVSNFYSSDPAGPCRLWIYSNLTKHHMLPMLFANKTDSSESATGVIHLSNGQDTLFISAISYNTDGKFQYHFNTKQKLFPCFPPFEIRIGKDYSQDCTMNITELHRFNNKLIALYTVSDNIKKSLSIVMRKPNGHLVQKSSWHSKKITKHFLFRRSLSMTSNMTNLIYLRSLIINLRLERNQHSTGSLTLYLTVEAQYSVKSPLSDRFITSVKVTQDLPIAGVITGLQIWGSILSIMMTIYAVIQWRGVMRRGGHVATLLPLMAGSVADAFYFATWSTVVHALAAEAGTLGLTLPLSPSEESVIEAMIYASLSLKVLKIAYVNYNICSRDIFFIDWSEYNPYLKDTPLFDRSNSNTSSILAREWAAIQTKRRTSPCVTVILTLFLLHLSEPWRSTVPDSQAYSWTLAVIAWWSSYLIVFLSHMALNRLFSSPSTVLPKLCADIEYSILIFQEDLFAHYVHGRNDDLSEAKYLSGPLITCRVICAAQFRAICKQLSTTTESSLTNIKSKQVLLSRFLAAFIERALDGLSWVASERTTLEKLFDVELMVREGGNTSILLYETENISPSCFAVTWWGNELTLSTFDSILFCSVAYGTREPIYAAITTVVLWQVMKYTTTWFSNRNLRNKLNVTF